MPSQTPHPYNALTPERVLDAIESTGRLTDARVFALNSYENRVFQIGIEDEPPLIAKFYRPGRWSDAQILEEHAFTQELATAGVPAVAPLQDEHGHSLFEHQGFRFALYPRRGGHAPELDNPDHLYTLGKYLGRIHALGQLRLFQHRPQLDVASFGHASRRTILEQASLSPRQRHRYDEISHDLLVALDQRFSDFGETALQRLHGDCHVGNILWRDNAPCFVDFDDSRNGPAVQDLWMLLSGDRSQHIMQLSEVLDGYQEYCDFDMHQLNLIEPLRALRLMHYSAWLTRRRDDPAFIAAFPTFNTEAYWDEHLLELQEQRLNLEQPPLRLY